MEHSTPVTIDPMLKKIIPNFKIGVITYHHIANGPSPQMLKGRLRLYQEELALQLEESELFEFEGIVEWKSLVEKLKTDPDRRRSTVESLYQRIKDNQFLPSINSAIDITTFFVLRHQVPIGIYDLSALEGNIQIRLGTLNDSFIGNNEENNTMEGILLSADSLGAFGSPITDYSKRAIIKENTTAALHLVYIRPTMDLSEAGKLMQSIATMFTELHGGEYNFQIVT